MPYIYKITNKINNKIYIGMTYRTVAERWNEHCNSYKYARDNHRPLYNAMNKYGLENFSIEVIEETDNPEEREKYWIEQYNSFKYGYNATKGGDGKSYIDYDLVISTYQEVKNIAEVSRIMSIDSSTISGILHRANISIKDSSIIIKEKAGKKVGMYEKQKLVKTFASMGDAARFLIKNKKAKGSYDNPNGVVAHIGQVCKGKRQTAYGYKWKILES